ncbi:MAG: HD-GYP domain-containing protein [Vicinamibacterales bacterium]
MTGDPSIFLHSFAQAIAVMALYPSGHPSRERTIDGAYQALAALPVGSVRSFTFLDGEVIYGREPLRELKDWDWGDRLAAVGIQRLEFERDVSRDEFEGFLQEILARVTPSATTAENRQMRALGVRFGAVGVQGQSHLRAAASPPAALDTSLREEAETLRWMQQEVQLHGTIPLLEAEAVVRSLAVAMHGDRRMVFPLLQLKEFDQYTTTHSLNVAVLAMGLAEKIGCNKKEIRAFGVAGLLHDIGKIRIPIGVLTKPGKLTEEERRMFKHHPADGARLILESDEALDVAAVVAYEHHMMLDGGGYPTPYYARPTALASRLVHVCDVFDALRTRRPYRDAWEAETVLAYLKERAGTEFDPSLVEPFVEMMRQSETQLSTLPEAEPAAPPRRDDVEVGR